MTKKMFLLFSHKLTQEQILDAKSSLKVEEFVYLTQELQTLWSNVPANEIDIDNYEKVLYADEVYSLLKESYKDVKGGLLFKNINDLVESTGNWDLIFFDSKVVGAIIYKAKKGLKMVALGISKHIDRKILTCVKSMLTVFCRRIFKFSWMEVSEGAEKFFMKNGASNYLIPNTFAKQLLNGKDIIELCDDGYHYKREIKKGVVKTKVLIGNPKSRFKRH